MRVSYLMPAVTTDDVREDDPILCLCRRLVAGDEEAWRFFHGEYRDRLRRYLSVVWKGPEDVLDDLVQAAFLRAVRNIREFRSEEALWCWLALLGRCAARDAGRKRGRFFRFLERWRREPNSLERIDLPDVRDAMDRLPGEVSQLLDWKYLDELSVREIAAELGIGEKAVESRMTRARAQLRKELES